MYSERQEDNGSTVVLSNYMICTKDNQKVDQGRKVRKEKTQNLFSWFGHVKNWPRKNMKSCSLFLTIVTKISPIIDQDLPYSYADNFSRDKIKNKNSSDSDSIQH